MIAKLIVHRNLGRSALIAAVHGADRDARRTEMKPLNNRPSPN
jgi:hypothetical protein